VHRVLMGKPASGDDCEEEGVDGKIILKLVFNMP